MRVLQSIAVTFCLVLMLEGCDTTSNIKNPNDFFFTKFFGLDGNQTGDDLVVSLSDGSFYLFGTTRHSFEQTSQWYLVKSDANGMWQWEKKFGSPALDETASDIELTSDGKLVLLGNVYKTPTDRDVRIMTVTLDGVPLDSAIIPILDNLGAVTSGDEDASSVTETSDGFIIAGSTTYVGFKTPASGYSDTRDALNIRVNKNLTPYLGGWPVTQTYGNYSDDVTRKIYQLSDGSFYLFGFSDAAAPGQTLKNYNLWYYKTGSTGTTSNNGYLGNQSVNEKLGSVTVAPPEAGSYYILSGLAFDPAGNGDILVSALNKTLTFDNQADPFFQNTYSINIGPVLTEKTAVVASKQGGYYVLVNEKSFSDNQNWLLFKVGNNGKEVWNLPIVFGGEGPDEIGAIQETPDGKILMIGTMRTGKPDVGETKMTLIKVNQDGKFEN